LPITRRQDPTTLEERTKKRGVGPEGENFSLRGRKKENREKKGRKHTSYALEEKNLGKKEGRGKPRGTFTLLGKRNVCTQEKKGVSSSSFRKEEGEKENKKKRSVTSTAGKKSGKKKLTETLGGKKRRSLYSGVRRGKEKREEKQTTTGRGEERGRPNEKKKKRGDYFLPHRREKGGKRRWSVAPQGKGVKLGCRKRERPAQSGKEEKKKDGKYSDISQGKKRGEMGTQGRKKVRDDRRRKSSNDVSGKQGGKSKGKHQEEAPEPSLRKKKRVRGGNCLHGGKGGRGESIW